MKRNAHGEPYTAEATLYNQLSELSTDDRILQHDDSKDQIYRVYDAETNSMKAAMIDDPYLFGCLAMLLLLLTGYLS
ncbi:hypothetical protein MRB53_041664 [Persea americana]|nr:hypothetical protein MRB53_041664 [Persea americana]